MAIDLEAFDKQVDTLVQQINEAQAEVLAVEIAAGFVAGLEAGEKKKSFLRSSSEELTQTQKETIDKLSAEYFGYIAEFNEAAGWQLKIHARALILRYGENSEILNEKIRKYAKSIWGGSEAVKIDRTGQTRELVRVNHDLTLETVKKEISRPYSVSVDAYADMLARTAMHGAYEDGRAAAYQEEGLTMWRFAGPVDERSRPDHSALVGQHFTYGTPESEMAQRLLREPNCRHRAVPYFDDPELDTPMEEFDLEKRKAGLQFDNEKGEWVFGDPETAPEKYPRAPDTRRKQPAKTDRKTLEYTPQKTVKAAEAWLLENTDVKYVDFKGVKIEIVNEMNERLVHHLNLVPKLKDKMNFYGTGQVQYNLYYEAEVKRVLEHYKKLFPGDPEDVHVKLAKRHVKKPKMTAYAHSWDIANYDFGGIAINKKFGSDPTMFTRMLQNDVEHRWHPVGCDTPKSVIDHEFGHMIDYIYGVSRSSVVDKCYREMSVTEIQDNLSRYAATNRKEFVAEAWAEYLNNPEPRPIAKEIGDYIMSRIKEDTQ